MMYEVTIHFIPYAHVAMSSPPITCACNSEYLTQIPNCGLTGLCTATSRCFAQRVFHRDTGLVIFTRGCYNHSFGLSLLCDENHPGFSSRRCCTTDLCNMNLTVPLLFGSITTDWSTSMLTNALINTPSNTAPINTAPPTNTAPTGIAV